jgi:hypothetical protein
MLSFLSPKNIVESSPFTTENIRLCENDILGCGDVRNASDHGKKKWRFLRYAGLVQNASRSPKLSETRLTAQCASVYICRQVCFVESIPMATTPFAAPSRHLISVDAFHRMGETGILGPADRVELIERAVMRPAVAT